MNVLVTGGAGFVGTALIPQLLAAGHQVTVLDCLLYGGEQTLPFFQHPGFRFKRGDIRNLPDVQDAVRDQDIIIHLAAIVGYPACKADPTLAEQVNVQGARNLASACSKEQRVLFGSTGSNYGVVDGICTEDTPLNPLSHYGRTKTIAESILLERENTTAFRFATAFGVSPRMRLDLLVNDLTYQAVRQGYLVIYERHFKRTFIHVRDMGRAFLLAVSEPEKMQGVLNIGSEKLNYSKEHICELIRAQTGCYVHYADVGEDADKRDYIVSYEKARRAGFDTTVSIEDGIAELKASFAVLGPTNPYSNVRS